MSTKSSLLSVPKIQFILLASIYDIEECYINQKEWLVSEFWPCSWCCLKLEQTVLTGLLICLLIWEGHIQLFETLKIVLYSQEPVPQYTFSFKEICWELVEIQKLQYAYRGSVFTRSHNDLCKDLYSDPQKGSHVLQIWKDWPITPQILDIKYILESYASPLSIIYYHLFVAQIFPNILTNLWVHHMGALLWLLIC